MAGSSIGHDSGGGGGEYEVIPLRPSWGSLSLLFFLAALSIRPLLEMGLGSRAYSSIRLIAFSVPILGLTGLLCGLLGLRLSHSKPVAKLGVFLNGTVVFITVSMIIVFSIVRYVR